ncbi:hypothetical protein ACN47E_001023 [Coniothyrium glycines]
MAVARDRTAVPDANEAPATSAPVRVPADAADKLCAAVPLPAQARQHVQDKTAPPHQALDQARDQAAAANAASHEPETLHALVPAACADHHNMPAGHTCVDPAGHTCVDTSPSSPRLDGVSRRVGQAADIHSQAPQHHVAAAPLTLQETTLADLRAQKAALTASLTTLSTVRRLIEKSSSNEPISNNAEYSPSEADIMTASNKLVTEHIKLLHQYNELKDVGQGLIGLIADQRGVRIAEVQTEFGIDARD